MAEAMSESVDKERRGTADEIDSWWSDAPITNRQLDVIRGDLDNELAPEGPRFGPQVVRKLLAEIDRLRADQPELTDEWGIGTDYTDTTRSEQAVSDNLAEALHLLDIARIHRSPDVVSEELIVREAGEWRKPEEER